MHALVDGLTRDGADDDREPETLADRPHKVRPDRLERKRVQLLHRRRRAHVRQRHELVPVRHALHAIVDRVLPPGDERHDLHGVVQL